MPWLLRLALWRNLDSCQRGATLSVVEFRLTKSLLFLLVVIVVVSVVVVVVVVLATGESVTGVTTLSLARVTARSPLLMSDYQSLEMISRSSRAPLAPGPAGGRRGCDERRNIHEAPRARRSCQVFYASRSTIHSTILCLSAIIINGISPSPTLPGSSSPVVPRRREVPPRAF